MRALVREGADDGVPHRHVLDEAEEAPLRLAEDRELVEGADGAAAEETRAGLGGAFVRRGGTKPGRAHGAPAQLGDGGGEDGFEEGGEGVGDGAVWRLP